MSFFSTFIFAQTYNKKTTLLEILIATELAKEIAKTANKNLIWHKFENYKEDDHMHEYYILKENEDEDFIFFTDNYDCAGCLHIEFKAIDKKMLLDRIGGSENYMNKIWSKYFNNSDKSKPSKSKQFLGSYKYVKEKHVWAIKRV